MDDLMDETSYGKAARQKFGAVPDGFHVYAAEWIGDGPKTWTAMRVKGAQFTGRRRVPGTTMETIVTKQEMAAHHKPPNVEVEAPLTARKGEK